MTEPVDRIARFRRDVEELEVRDPVVGRERLLAGLGVGLMGLGVALAVAAYLMSHGADSEFNTEGPAVQRDAIVVALVGASTTVVGAALFLRYSLAQFLRFWLARLVYEQRVQTDRIVGDRAETWSSAARGTEPPAAEPAR
jgi:multisubunit Na+/H+ antiporter MnhB subunit